MTFASSARRRGFSSSSRSHNRKVKWLAFGSASILVLSIVFTSAQTTDESKLTQARLAIEKYHDCASGVTALVSMSPSSKTGEYYLLMAEAAECLGGLNNLKIARQNLAAYALANPNNEALKQFLADLDDRIRKAAEEQARQQSQQQAEAETARRLDLDQAALRSNISGEWCKVAIVEGTATTTYIFHLPFSMAVVQNGNAIEGALTYAIPAAHAASNTDEQRVVEWPKGTPFFRGSYDSTRVDGTIRLYPFFREDAYETKVGTLDFSLEGRWGQEIQRGQASRYLTNKQRDQLSTTWAKVQLEISETGDELSGTVQTLSFAGHKDNSSSASNSIVLRRKLPGKRVKCS